MSPTLAWIALIASGLVDVAWALAMKKADGFANPLWSAVSVLLLAVFVYLLTKALQVLPVGTAYAVWTGIGAAGTVVAGMVLFAEPVSALRLACIAMVVAGIAGLKLTSA
jgi:quaternary ammonium compound-resistance protein SugE